MRLSQARDRRECVYTDDGLSIDVFAVHSWTRGVDPADPHFCDALEIVSILLEDPDEGVGPWELSEIEQVFPKLWVILK